MTCGAIVLLTVCCGSTVQQQVKAKEVAAKDPKDVDTRVADILFVPVDAKVDPPPPFGPIAVKNGRSTYIDGTTDIWFSIDANREKLTSELVRYFASRGWRQRTNQFLNPQFATSFAGGWQQRCACLLSRDANDQIRPRGQMFEWQGEWENARHDHVTYVFLAEDRAIHGGGYYQPAAIIDEVSRKLGRDPAQAGPNLFSIRWPSPFSQHGARCPQLTVVEDQIVRRATMPASRCQRLSEPSSPREYFESRACG